MTLGATLAALDDTALEALANKGLVRRARRDLDSGTVTVTECTETQAQVNVDDLTVTLNAQSPLPGDCPCPATKLCRHVLSAVMAVAAIAEEVAQPDAAPPPRQAISDLTQQEFEALAGADLIAALTLGAEPVEITEDGATLAVRLQSWNTPVQFLTGRPLTEAVFKGPKTRARLARAAAIAALRVQMGQPFAWPKGQTAPDTLSDAYLTEVQNAVETLILGVLRGGADAAMDHVFDLAISARVQVAPRLTGALRNLIGLARQLAARDVHATPEAFLCVASRVTALIHALKDAPSDPILCGTLRRDYAPQPDMEILCLGAEAWTAPSGARGLRIYGWDMLEARWVTAAAARAAGSDLGFTATGAYHLPLLGAARVPDVMGRRLTLSAPNMSQDLQLSPSTTGQLGAHMTRSDLTASLSTQPPPLGGLRAGLTPHPRLITPGQITPGGFDDASQMYRLLLENGERLNVPLAQADAVEFLVDPSAEIVALLCTAQREVPFGHPPALTLVSALVQDKAGLRVINSGLDRVPAPKKRGRLVQLFRGPSQVHVQAQSVHDPLRTLVAGSVSYVTDRLSHPGAQPPSPQRMAEASGLTLISQALADFEAEPNAATGLRVGYLADRVLQTL